MPSGRTKTTTFSLDEATLKGLKALARRNHKGDVSALLSDIVAREMKLAAADAFFVKYGIAPLTDEAIARVEAEWQREPAPRKRKRAA